MEGLAPINQPYAPDDRYIDVTAAIILERGNFLIARRAPGEKYAGKWEFPGGKVEAGETLEQCLKREIEEELRMTIRVGSIFSISEYDYGREDAKKHRFFSFWCTRTNGEPVLTVHDGLAWTPVARLQEFDLIDADRQIIRDLLAALGKS